MLREYLSNIADQFRTHLDTTEPINAQDFAGKVGEVYDKGFADGYSNAVKEGTITITGASKTLSISGLDAMPKELHLLAFNAYTPTNDNDAFIGCLNYLKDGFSYGGTAKVQAALWLRTATGAANGSVAKAVADKNNVFTFENGTFTIDMSYNTRYCFGENYTYHWTVTF